MGGDGGRPRREAMILVIARVCVAISALDHFELGRGSRSEIASSFVLAASSFALISSNFTPKVASMSFTFVASWSMRTAGVVLRGAESLLTQRWRGADSNHRSRARKNYLSRPPCLGEEDNRR